MRMGPALNESSTLERFERSNASEIRNGIMFDFYPGLPHTKIFCTLSHTESGAADISFSSVSPHTVEHVFVLDDGSAGVVTIFIVSTFPV